MEEEGKNALEVGKEEEKEDQARSEEESRRALICSSSSYIARTDGIMVRKTNDRRRARVPQSLTGLFDRKWVKLVAIVFAIELLALVFSSMVPLNQDQQSSLLTVLNSSRSEIMNQSMAGAAVYIFAHNLGIATLEITPGVGLLVFSGSTALTGLTLGAEAASYGLPPALVALVLFTLPSTWFELAAYAIAVVANIYILRAIFRGGFTGELRRYASSWVLAGAVLLIAAMLESFEIQSEQSNPVSAYLAWIPAAIIILLTVLLLRRKTKG